MPFAFRNRLSRRALLRAGAVSVALPLLDAMRPGLARAAGAAPAPRRLVVVQRPLGTYGPYLFPETPGPGYEPTRLLKLLEGHRGKFTVFSGVSHPGYPNTHGSEFGVLTAVHPDGIRRPEDLHNTVSLDQAAAAAVGRQTRVPYLLLGHMNLGVSFSPKGVPLPGETRRAEVFARLFLDGTPAEVARTVRRVEDGRSILDGVRDQLRALAGEVGAADRDRLDVLASSIRDAEQSLAQEREWAARPKPKVPPAGPDAAEWVGQTRQWYDLIHLAAQTDSTRVVVCRVGENAPAPTVPGVTLGEHDASHHGKDPVKVEQVARFEEAHFRSFDYLLKKLAETPEAGGSLLDHTQVLFVSNLGDASAHSPANLPVLLAGGGYRHPGHMAFDRQKNYPLSHLYARMLRQMGIPADSFGAGTGVLTELR